MTSPINSLEKVLIQEITVDTPTTEQESELKDLCSEIDESPPFLNQEHSGLLYKKIRK